MQATADAIIVGGGIIGVSIAYHLAQQQAGDILLLERDGLAGATTGRSVASIDHLTLQPHAVGLFAQSAAFFAHFDEIVGSSCEFVQTGSIILAGEEPVAGLVTAVAAMQAAGIEVDALTPAELSDIEPRMRLDGVVAASFAPQAGYADPALTTQALAAAARRLGVTIKQGCAVTGLNCRGGRVVGVETAVGSVSAPIVIIAAGAWSSQLLRTVGIELPLQPVLHPVVCLQRPLDFHTHHSLLDLTTGIYARPETGGLTLLGSIDPQIGYDPINPDVGEGFVHDDYILWSMERLLQRYPLLEMSQLRPGWTGIMTISPDWQPVIGSWSDFHGLYCATGFSGQGFQISPAVGDFLTNMILGDAVAADQLAPFTPDRFVNGKMLRTDHDGETFGILG